MAFREQLQAVVERVLDPGAEPDEVRKALRKGVSAEAWQRFVSRLFESLHQRDAIATLAAIRLTRPLEAVEETLSIHTETRSANMRVQAATKEPWTYAWLRSMKQGETLYDVGANVGAYALVAMARGLQVVAFEPHHENFRDLCRNAALNGLSARLTALPLALSDERALVRNPANAAFDTAGATLVLGAEEGPLSIVTAPLDALVEEYRLPPPDHVKIDVDGYEGRVLDGARRTLSGGRLKSCLIEVDERAAVPGRWGREQVAEFLAGSGLAVSRVTAPMASGVAYLLATRGPAAPVPGLALDPI